MLGNLFKGTRDQNSDKYINPIYLESRSFESVLSCRRLECLEDSAITLQVDCKRWQQSSEDLRKQAVKASHSRTRERLMALYEISKGQSATQVGQATNRHPQTVMEWVHRYNNGGLAAFEYQRTGGRLPLYPPPSSKR